MRVLTWNVGIAQNGEYWDYEEFDRFLNKGKNIYDIIFLQEVPIETRKFKICERFFLSSEKEYESEYDEWLWTIHGKENEKISSALWFSENYHVIKSNNILKDDHSSSFIFITLINKKWTARYGNNFHKSEISNITYNGSASYTRAFVIIPFNENENENVRGPALINIHLTSKPNNTKIRFREAMCIRTYTSLFKNVVLAGDFNCEEDEAKELAQKMVPDIQLWDNSESFTYSYVKSKKDNSKKIDWIFSKGIDKQTVQTFFNPPNGDKKGVQLHTEEYNIGRHFPVGSI